MPYSTVISKAFDRVSLLKVRGILIKEKGVLVAINDPHVLGLLIPHGIFIIKPAIKKFTNLLYMLKIIKWV